MLVKSMVKVCQVPILNVLLTGSRFMPFTSVNLRALMKMVSRSTQVVMYRNLLTSLRFLHGVLDSPTTLPIRILT